MTERSGTAQPVYDAIRTRRVTRSMSDEPVASDDLDQVLAAARWAPSAGNRRLQPVVPVTDPLLLRLLRLVSPGMVPRPQAALVVCVDTARAADFGFDPDWRGLYVDVGTTAATLLLAAHAVGLGACPVTSFSRAAVGRLLGLAPGVRPELVVCLGHPAADQPATMSALQQAAQLSS
ncbi:MAG TPA: nitroreductase family protein [Nocardioides bacterium]|uniref:nitroreductase family protein n=1 Tax=uncultured Nocardioides sp. TaxID=198441 RepID=UPI000ED5A2E6|nr:nitroreductase family protein [uncultured Nocardioides sp.]HCB06453.1 nitroreductase family protein [Nocardioides sp.]